MMVQSRCLLLLGVLVLGVSGLAPPGPAKGNVVTIAANPFPENLRQVMLPQWLVCSRDGDESNARIAACQEPIDGQRLMTVTQTVLGLFFRASAHMAKGQTGQAIADRDIVHAGLDQFEQALSDYDAVIRRRPDHIDMHNNRDSVFFCARQFYLVITDYDDEIRHDPDFAIAHQSRGRAYAALGQHDFAIPDYNEAIRLDPKQAKLRGYGLTKQPIAGAGLESVRWGA